MKHWHPLWHLTISRLREEYREPAVVFWVYVFPVALAIGLGIAFGSGPPQEPQVASGPPSSAAPGGRYIDFLVPGLVALSVMSGGLWGVGYVVVDLRVRSLLKRLLATPMRRSQLLLSIILSRMVFVAPGVVLLLAIGRLCFGTPLGGNLLLLILVLLAGGAAFAGLGLLLASRAARTEVISGIINVITFPLWMLCGTFFSTQRWPAVLQPLIEALPLKHFNDALRAVLLHDAGLSSVAGNLAILVGWGVVCFVLALLWFRWH